MTHNFLLLLMSTLMKLAFAYDFGELSDYGTSDQQIASYVNADDYDTKRLDDVDQKDQKIIYDEQMLYRGDFSSYSLSMWFLVDVSATDELSENVNRVTSSCASFVMCSGECLLDSSCAGIMYHKQTCYILVTDAGLRSHEAKNGTVEAMIYMNLDYDISTSGTTQLIDGLELLDRSEKDCIQWYLNGFETNGIFSIDPMGNGPFNVSCDMTSDGAGWIVIQRRVDGSTDFFRNWTEYVDGFGNLSHNFWAGLKILNELTIYPAEMIVYLEEFDGRSASEFYESVSIGNETSGYQLKLTGSVHGPAGNSLDYHNGKKFSTFNNQQYPSKPNCALDYKSGWWFYGCHSSNLNGEYLANTDVISGGPNGIDWLTFNNRTKPIKTSVMKLRNRARADMYLSTIRETT